MDTINRRRTQLSVAAVAALAIFAVAAVMLLAGSSPTQAQSQGNIDDYVNLSTYPDPQPCGPGAGTASMAEPHEITTGHYALFDAYWRTISEGGGGPDADGVGVLHTNLCPPLATQTTKTEGSGRAKKTITVTSRSARNGGMDVDEAIMHVLDTHKADVVATNAAATGGQLSLEEYPGVGAAVGAGDSVWWLRLDDPDTVDDPNTPEKENDETSDLGIGFSTLLLDKEDWLTRAEGKPMRYKFEVERHPADPTDDPHFFTYEAPKADNAEAELVWDSTKPDIDDDDMLLDPGEYRALQWVFTKPGTYILSVHLLGEARQTNPHAQDHPDYDPNWKPISGNVTETSEVYRYTIQVGNKLDEIEPPIFGVNLSVEENSPAGVKVGDPIPVYNADAKVLYYDLTGPGHSDFEPVVASTDPHAVQVVVADGASLDYETKSSYDLNLIVTDKVDHEDNFNPYPDDVLIVKIDLKDQAPGLELEVDRKDPGVGETVYFIARYEATPEQLLFDNSAFEWEKKKAETDRNNRPLWRALDLGTAPDAPTWSVSQSSAVTETYRVSVELWNDDDDLTLTPPTFVNSNEVEVTWK